MILYYISDSILFVRLIINMLLDLNKAYSGVLTMGTFLK